MQVLITPSAAKQQAVIRLQSLSTLFQHSTAEASHPPPKNRLFLEVLTPIGSGQTYHFFPSLVAVTGWTSTNCLLNFSSSIAFHHHHESIHSPQRWRQYVPLRDQNIWQLLGAETPKKTIIWGPWKLTWDTACWQHGFTLEGVSYTHTHTHINIY